MLSLLDFDIFGVPRLEADQFASAGYFLTILSFVSIFIVWKCFTDPPSMANSGHGIHSFFHAYA